MKRTPLRAGRLAGCVVLALAVRAAAQQEFPRAEPVVPKAVPVSTNAPVPAPQPQPTPAAAPAEEPASPAAGAMEATTPDAAAVPDPIAVLDGLRKLASGRQWEALSERATAFLQEYPDSDARDEVLYRLGEARRGLKDDAGAEARFREVIDAHAKSPWAPFARIRVGEILLQRGDAEKALPFFESAASDAKTAGGRLNAHFLSAVALGKLGRPKDARPHLEQVVAQETDNPYRATAWYELARLKDGAGDADGALAAYRRVLDAPGASAAVRADAGLRAGNLLLRRRREDEAAKVFEAVRATGHEPARVIADLGLLRVRFAQGRHADVLAAWEQLKERVPESARPGALYCVANAQRLSGQLGVAAETYAVLLAIKPEPRESEGSAYERLMCLAQMKSPDVESASAQFLDRWPSSEHGDAVRYLRARQLFARRDFAAAAPLLEAVVKSGKPANVQESAQYDLAQTLMALGRDEAAAAAFERALSRYPEAPGAADALYRQGALLDRLGRDPEAIDVWGRLAQRFPEHPGNQTALLRRGLMLANAKRWQEARSTLDQLVKRFPKTADLAQARYWRGRAALELQQWDAAERDLEWARKENAAMFAGPALGALYAQAVARGDRDRIALYAEQWDDWVTEHPKEGERVPAATWFWLAQQYENAKKFDQAEKFHTRVVRSDDTKLRPFAQLGAGRAQLEQKRFANAVMSYEAYLAENPAMTNSPAVLMPLGQAQLGAASWLAAATTAERLLALAPEGPGSAEARMLQADAAAGSGNHAHAARLYGLLATIVQDDPNLTPRALARAVECHRRAGNTTQAAEYEKQLQARFPNAPRPPGLTAPAPPPKTGG